MPAKKKPVATLKAEGSRHYTKDELAEREAREIRPPETTTVKAPSYVTGSLLKEFNRLAPVLVKMGTLSSVDGDVLARYLIARQQYVHATNEVTKALAGGTLSNVEKWSVVQDRFFKQVRASAAELGLSVSSRANLLLPAVFAADDTSPEEADMFGS